MVLKVTNLFNRKVPSHLNQVNVQEKIQHHNQLRRTIFNSFTSDITNSVVNENVIFKYSNCINYKRHTIQNEILTNPITKHKLYTTTSYVMINNNIILYCQVYYSLNTFALSLSQNSKILFSNVCLHNSSIRYIQIEFTSIKQYHY